jgi:N-acetylglucosamine repressor
LEIKAMNSESMGRSNRLVILSLIRKYPGISRRELAKMTGLNPSTVTNIIFDLIEKGFVQEGEKGFSGKPGKRRVSLFPSKEAATAIIAKIGIENTQIGLGYLDNSFEKIYEINTSPLFDDFFGIFGEKIHTLYKKENLRSKVTSLTISVPGVVNKDTISIETAPHLGWSKVEIGKRIKERFGDMNIPIHLDNDAKLSLMAEMYFNDVIQNMVNGAYIYISQGIGGALLINGEIFFGTSFTAGEVGHMSIYADGPVCHCGNKGCWEEYISIDTIVRKYEAKGRVLEGKNFKGKFENLILKSKKDKVAKDVLIEMMHYLAVGITNLTNIINPQFVMIGGMGEKIPSAYIQILKNEVKERALESATRHLLIMTSSMDMIQSTLEGCTLMAMNEFSKEAIL